MDPSESKTGEHAHLHAWLDARNARFCYALKPPKGDKTSPRIEAWRVGAAIVLVMLYPNNGWDVYTSCGDNNIEVTLADANARTQ
jgi:hypothetical protein